ncbi:MAG: amidohydrolase family protein [Planctomycetales bacterium]|nr:amidohydrolase family protein [Planctomycetales bacterium]
MSGKIIDFHTHAFPDALAERAMRQLKSECAEVHSYLDGKLSSLLESMEQNGIEKSVLCCIATRPEQFEPIFNWCCQIASERIIPLPSIHPQDPAALERIERVADAGFKGVKLHPYYQSFFLDDPALSAFWQALCDKGLLVTVHTGYDIAFERIERASPRQILRLLEAFPSLKFVATHLGGWQQWDQVEQLVLGKPIAMEVSWSMEYLGAARARDLLLKHSPDHILFGTDSPWTDQAKTIQSYKKLDLPHHILEKFFYTNAMRLLQEVG